MRTQVGIIGAGPAGLLLAHLLQRRGIASIVVESQTRPRVEERVRAGVLEEGTVELLEGSGLGDRLRREGLGIELRFAGAGHRAHRAHRAFDHGLRPAGGREGPHSRAPRRGRRLGAKGMNLAVNDVRVLAEVLAAFYAGGERALDEYSPRCPQRIWRAEHFSWWMTSMLHRFDNGDPFHDKLQLAQLEYVTTSKAAATSLAENYAGLPFD